ncbi:MAG: ribbon-helix-helix protein, CopG family, partial [Candidatus Bipolaricaulota bacterium]
MGRLVRFSVSMDEELVAAFDADAPRRGYPSRSEAIRDAMRQR